MDSPPLSPWRRPQAGGVTILVSLMLLALLTTAAVAMSRNSLREIATVGFGRQGAMARNTADSGLEWSILWLDPQNAAGASASAQRLAQLRSALLARPSLAGTTWDAASASPTAPTAYSPGGALAPDLQWGTAGVTQGCTLGITYLGKLPVADLSQGAGPGAYTPAAGAPSRQAPDLWAVRADAQVTQGGATFIHAREAWVSTPAQ